MSRIPILKETELNDEQRRVYEEIKESRQGKVPDLFMALLHSPVLADHGQRLGTFHRHRSSLPTRLVELSILTTAKHWSCAYEWHFHESAARENGLDGGVIEAIRDGAQLEFQRSDESAVYAYTHELLVNRHVSDETYQAAWDELGTVGVVDLTSLIGYYCMIAMTLNEHGVPLPEGITPALAPPV